MPPPKPFKVILARSPYQVIINEPTQIATKVELRLWNKGTTKPTNPTYIMSEGIASVTQTETNYNISPFILEYIDKYYPIYNADNVIFAGNKEWCIGEYITYYQTNLSDEWVETDVVEFCGVNGFSTPEQGMNYDITNLRPYLFLANELLKVYWNTNTPIPFYNFIVRHVDKQYEAQWINKSGNTINSVIFYDGEDDYFNFAIPLVYGASVRLEIVNRTDGELVTKIETEEICEPLYPVEMVYFVNHYGGWNYLPFFKASYNSIDVKNSDYALMQKNVDYDYRRGQRKSFNVNGNQSIKVNTGWIEEVYFELIQDIMLSDTIIYSADEIPVTIKTSTMQKKTYLTDKNINYTLEFDFANKLINNIV
jgi:hypothetical protein